MKNLQISSTKTQATESDEKPSIIKIAFLDVGQADTIVIHHGGAWDRVSAEELLDNIQPSVVVISVGTEGSKYKHPNEHIFTALAQRPHVRVLCTQATDQCQKVLLNCRDAVMQQLEAEAGKNGYLMIGSRRGCPCSGTVIIELGDNLRVLQPEINFHHEHIIRPYFAEHKCNISDVKVEYMIVGQQSAERSL